MDANLKGCPYSGGYCDFEISKRKSPTPSECLVCAIQWAGIRISVGLEKVARAIEEKI